MLVHMYMHTGAHSLPTAKSIVPIKFENLRSVDNNVYMASLGSF